MCSIRWVVALAFLLILLADGDRSGKVLYTEDTHERYIQLREGRPGYVSSSSTDVAHRPELSGMRELNGDLDFICKEVNGAQNPRILIESNNTAHYQVIYKWGDREALKVIAKFLKLRVTQEDREIQAITLRTAPGGHRLKSAAKGMRFKPEEACCDTEGRWALVGITSDELAHFLEGQYGRPVANMTSLKGRWSITLSEKTGKALPSIVENVPLDDLGLELRWEKVKIPLTIVQDERNGKRHGK